MGSPGTPKTNAEATLRRGGILNPPRSLPYHMLARTCLGCGDLVTTPAHLLRRDAGALPKCHTCHIAAVLATKKKRAARDPEFYRALRNHADRQRGRAQSRTMERARNRGQQWTGPQLEIAAREDLTAAEVAVLTGRTLYAVKHARRKLRDEPKWIQVVGLGQVVADG